MVDPPTTVYHQSGPFALFNDPAIDNNGMLAFRGVPDAGGSGIYRGNGVVTTVIDEDPANTFVFGAFYDMNAAGTVAYLKLPSIMTGNGGPPTVVADSSGPFQFLFDDPGINAAGEVAFFARLDNGIDGIFTGPDPALDEVISVGDPLAGSTVRGLTFSGRGLGDSGQIAFVAQLADRSFVVVRADPVVTAVPEPGTLLLLALSLASAFGLRSVRSRA